MPDGKILLKERDEEFQIEWQKRNRHWIELAKARDKLGHALDDVFRISRFLRWLSKRAPKSKQ